MLKYNDAQITMLKYDNAAYFITGFFFTYLNWKIRQARPLTKLPMVYWGYNISHPHIEFRSEA